MRNDDTPLKFSFEVILVGWSFPAKEKSFFPHTAHTLSPSFIVAFLVGFLILFPLVASAVVARGLMSARVRTVQSLVVNDRSIKCLGRRAQRGD